MMMMPMIFCLWFFFFLASAAAKRPDRFPTSASRTENYTRPDVDLKRCGPLYTWRVFDQYVINATITAGDVIVRCPLILNETSWKRASAIFHAKDDSGTEYVKTSCIHMPQCQYNGRQPFWTRELQNLYCTVPGFEPTVEWDWLLNAEPEIGWVFIPKGYRCISKDHLTKTFNCKIENMNDHGGRIRIRTFVPITLRLAQHYEVNRWYEARCGDGDNTTTTRSRCVYDSMAGRYRQEHELLYPCVRLDGSSIHAQPEVISLGQKLYESGSLKRRIHQPSSEDTTAPSTEPPILRQGIPRIPPADWYDGRPPSSSSQNASKRLDPSSWQREGLQIFL